MSERGRLLCGRVPSASRVIIDRPKARVLPEPVRPRPSTSRPAMASGIVAVLDRERVGDAVASEPLDEHGEHTEGGEAVVLGHLLGLTLVRGVVGPGVGLGTLRLGLLEAQRAVGVGRGAVLALVATAGATAVVARPGSHRWCHGRCDPGSHRWCHGRCDPGRAPSVPRSTSLRPGSHRWCHGRCDPGSHRRCPGRHASGPGSHRWCHGRRDPGSHRRCRGRCGPGSHRGRRDPGTRRRCPGRHASGPGSHRWCRGRRDPGSHRRCRGRCGPGSHRGRWSGRRAGPRGGRGGRGRRPSGHGRAPGAHRARDGVARHGDGARVAPRASRRPNASVGRSGHRGSRGWGCGSRCCPGPRGERNTSTRASRRPDAGPARPSAGSARHADAWCSRRRSRTGRRAWGRSSGRPAGRGGAPSWGPCGPRTSGQCSNGPSWARMPCWAWVCSPVFRHRTGRRQTRLRADGESGGTRRASDAVVLGHRGPWGRFDLGVTGAPGGMGRVALCDSGGRGHASEHLGGPPSLPAAGHPPDHERPLNSGRG